MSEKQRMGGHYTCFGGKLLNMKTTPVLYSNSAKKARFNVLFQCVVSMCYFNRDGPI